MTILNEYLKVLTPLCIIMFALFIILLIGKRIMPKNKIIKELAELAETGLVASILLWFLILALTYIIELY